MCHDPGDLGSLIKIRIIPKECTLSISGTRDISFHIQFNPGNSNYQGKLKLLQVIGVSSYRGFEQNGQKHLIKVVLCLYMFYCKISSNVKA